MTRMDAARYSIGEVTELLRRGFGCTTLADITEQQAVVLAKHMEHVEATRRKLENDWIAEIREAPAAKQRERLDEGINATFDDEPDPIYLETDADRYRGKPEPSPYNVHDNTIGFDIVEDDRGPEEPFLEPDDMPLALHERAPASSAPAREQVARAPAEPARPVTVPPKAREPDKAPSAPVRSSAAPSVRPAQARLPLRRPASQTSPPRPPAGQSVTVSQPSRSAIGSPKSSEQTIGPVAPGTGPAAGISTSVRQAGPPPGMMPRRSGFLPTTPVALADISPEALARATPDNPAIKTRIDPPPVSPSPPPPQVQQSSSAQAEQATVEDELPRHIRRPKWLEKLRDEDPPD
ncbi:hypothetical protein AOQ71_19565 [Bradyrhizobium manausense]|uniref:Uncharacterized protein n=2 Tax=Bradyrhizobium manausense TaxID=989370 RepID=A0A0R3DJW1_9BRAD|nr:hypothetical protein AOQ71_19565 [Bradyrhizobium manausense]